MVGGTVASLVSLDERAIVVSAMAGEGSRTVPVRALSPSLICDAHVQCQRLNLADGKQKVPCGRLGGDGPNRRRERGSYSGPTRPPRR